MSTTALPLADRTNALASELAQRTNAHFDPTTIRRAQYSTDASNYRIPPIGVLFPHTPADIEAAISACIAAEIPLTMRGAGTSCAGNAIGPGLVLDTSRHMGKILDINPEEKTATVQPGVILSELQNAARPYGLRFGPDPSTQNRCTIGGMIGNNACGPRAISYGRTADNVLTLDLIDGTGHAFTATAGPNALTPIRGLDELVKTNLALIRTTFGKFSRQVSGYSLEHLTPENGQNLAAMLVGSEGTLGAITQAKVRLVDISPAPVLVALGYPTMAEAADAVPALIKHRPLALEGLDARLVNVVRAHKGPGAVPDLPAGGGWLLAEVGGQTQNEALARANTLAADSGTKAIAIYPPGSAASTLWRIRADGAGLGGRTPTSIDPAGNLIGDNPAWPGWEDAAVPPENLGKYLRNFESLMADHKVDGLVFGHFGEGCIHVRLDLPLGSAASVPRTRTFLTEAAKLVASHGGSLSGEHGDGRARSELLKHMYSPEIISLFGQVKGLFDPNNLMNPGVLVHPDPIDTQLRRPTAQATPALKGKRGGFAFTHDKGDFTTAVHRCTGVGKCRANQNTTFMCPSFAATSDETDSTRGRARILQEATQKNLIKGFGSPQVRAALDLCLACKACSADCPAGIDMAKYRSEVLHRTYRNKLRPASHYLLGQLPRWTWFTARIPYLAKLANTLMRFKPVRSFAFTIAGIDKHRQMPPLAEATFIKWARNSGFTTKFKTDLPQADKNHKLVVLWADSFSQTLDDEAAKATASLLVEAGFEVLVPKDVCCGLTWITTGQLTGARRRQRKLIDTLAPFAANGIPIVGVEPSCTAVLRDDLIDLNPTDPRAHLISQVTCTLAELLTKTFAAEADLAARLIPDLRGTTVVAQPHCHHYSVMGWDADRKLLQQAGVEIIEISGCCGLAGIFGMEKGHYKVSKKIAGLKLLPALEANPQALYLADGFSCRTQAAQLAGKNGIHLAQLLGRGTAN